MSTIAYIKMIAKEQIGFSGKRTVLTRHGAPLLYAYDACSFINRLRGVKAIPPFGPTDALVLRPCSAVHTLRLKNPLDIVFLDYRGVILKIATVPPNRASFCWKSTMVVEMAAGTSERIGLLVGQVLLPGTGDWI